MSRSFTIEQIKKLDGKSVRYTGGRFISETPANSARKAFSKSATKGVNSLKITMRETTQNSSHKSYSYKVSRVKDYREVERDGKIIVYHYSTKIKAL